MKTRWIAAFAGSAVVVTGVLGLLHHTWVGEVTPAKSPTVAELMARDVVGMPSKEAVMITVAYLPGGASLPHRHDAQVFVYVLEGALTMQVDGNVPVTVGPGQTFYEGPHDVHRISANASQRESAKILVFMIKDKGKPDSRTVAPKEAP